MPVTTQYQPSDAYDLVATVPAGQTESQPLDLGGTDLCGLFAPANLTAAAVGLLAAPSPAGPYSRVQAGGADYALAVAAGKYTPVENLAVVAGLRFVKLVAATAQAGADAPITLAARPV